MIGTTVKATLKVNLLLHVYPTDIEFYEMSWDQNFPSEGYYRGLIRQKNTSNNSKSSELQQTGH